MAEYASRLSPPGERSFRPPGDRRAAEHGLLALQRSAGNRAVAAAMPAPQQTPLIQRCGAGKSCPCMQKKVDDDIDTGAVAHVQRSGADQDERNAPTEGGAEESGLGDAACTLLPDYVIVRMVRAYFALRYPLASRHLVHYLDGSGANFTEDITALFGANPRAAGRVAEQIRGQGGSGSGSLVGRTFDTAVIRQRDYDSEDWRLSLGGIDQFDYEVGEQRDDGKTNVQLTLTDPYEWHPAEDRGSQCLHATMEAQKAKGAKDYTCVGSATVALQL